MSKQITHRTDENGNLKQIVTAAELRRVLDQDGSSHDKPADWADADEWYVDALVY